MGNTKKNSKKKANISCNKKGYKPFYGDLSKLNTSRLILDSVGTSLLSGIVESYLDLLGTSVAIYEKNGDYALGILNSGWCCFLDAASRRLSKTKDNKKALTGGKWHCHESCWNKASRISIEKGQPVDTKCSGGINIYAVPIRAGDEIVGSINFGYGNPPKDRWLLKKIAEKYKVSEKRLAVLAQSYKPRPASVVNMAKKRLLIAARMIGEIVRRKEVEDILDRTIHNLNQRVKELNCLYGFSRLIEKPGISLNEILREAVSLINSAWQYPEAACVKIVWGDKEFTTKKCRLTSWKIVEPIMIEGKQAGFIRSCYSKEGAKKNKKPFLQEEKDLLNIFAKRLGKLIESEQRREKAAQAMEVKSDFISMVSHELRTPLTVIKECVNIISEETADKLDDELRAFLAMALNNTDRLSKLINSVLDLQKLESGKIALDMRANDINNTIKEVCGEMSRLAREKGLELSYKFIKRPPRIKFDKDKIAQVLANLIHNAINFTDKGGVWVKVYREKSAIRVSVKDTGIGIRKDDLLRIFKRFEQLGKPSERKGGGAGLGLAISKEIIDEHGGKIWVKSKFGKGAVFSFTIPFRKKRR